jgi:hypothetical protein
MWRHEHTHLNLTHLVLWLLLRCCRPLFHSTQTFTNFDTAVDVAVRPTSYQPSRTAGIWPKDMQGYTLLQHADTLEQYNKYQKQWVKYEATFKAPADKVQRRRSVLTSSMCLSLPCHAAGCRFCSSRCVFRHSCCSTYSLLRACLPSALSLLALPTTAISPPPAAAVSAAASAAARLPSPLLMQSAQRFAAHAAVCLMPCACKRPDPAASDCAEQCIHCLPGVPCTAAVRQKCAAGRWAKGTGHILLGWDDLNTLLVCGRVHITELLLQLQQPRHVPAPCKKDMHMNGSNGAHHCALCI